MVERRLFYVALTRAKKAIFLESPPFIAEGRQLPSRFLEEIQLPVTQKIFETYHRLIAYPETDPSIIFAAIKESKIPFTILETLQSYYFKQVVSDWAKEMLKVIGNASPNGFTYQHDYKDFHEMRNARNEQLAAPWHHILLKFEEPSVSEPGISVADHSDLVVKDYTKEGDPGSEPFADNDEANQTPPFDDTRVNDREVVAKLKQLAKSLRKKIFNSKGFQ